MQEQNNGYAPHPAKGKAIASLVLGIVAVVICWFGWVGILALVLAIIGVVLGVQARKELTPEEGRGMATAGMVLSIIALVLSSVVVLACTICVGAVASLGAF